MATHIYSKHLKTRACNMLQSIKSAYSIYDDERLKPRAHLLRAQAPRRVGFKAAFCGQA